MKQVVLRYRKPLLLIASLLFWFAVWWIVSALVDVPLILPSPFPVLSELGHLVVTGGFWLSLARSFLRIYAGALIGISVGVLFGLLSSYSRTADTLLSPVFSVIRATPVACFIIVAWVFLGRNNLPLFISSLMVAPILYTATLTGIRSADGALLEAAKIYRLSRPKTFRAVYLPSLAPHLSAALFNCVGLAWKAGIAAEVIVKTEESVGYAIWQAKSWEINPDKLYAWTLAVITVSLLFEYALKRIRAHRKGDPSCSN